MDKILKTYSAELTVDAGKREVLAVISTDAIDRDNEVVLPKGLKKKNYAGNPIVLFGHDTKCPIGKCLWVKEADGKILAKTYISDKTQLSRDVFGLMQDGVLSAFSIGFSSLKSSPPSPSEIKARPDLKDVRKIHREWEMFEYSVVPIPANPQALTLAVSKGYSSETLSAVFGKSEEGKGTEEADTEDKVVKAVVVPSADDIRTTFYKTLLKRLGK